MGVDLVEPVGEEWAHGVADVGAGAGVDGDEVLSDVDKGEPEFLTALLRGAARRFQGYPLRALASGTAGGSDALPGQCHLGCAHGTEDVGLHQEALLDSTTLPHGAFLRCPRG